MFQKKNSLISACLKNEVKIHTMAQNSNFVLTQAESLGVFST